MLNTLENSESISFNNAFAEFQFGFTFWANTFFLFCHFGLPEFSIFDLQIYKLILPKNGFLVYRL